MDLKPLAEEQRAVSREGKVHVGNGERMKVAVDSLVVDVDVGQPQQVLVVVVKRDAVAAVELRVVAVRESLVAPRHTEERVDLEVLRRRQQVGYTIVRSHDCTVGCSEHHEPC